MLTLRDNRGARAIAVSTLPRFPERFPGRHAARQTNGLLTSRAERHARNAWDDARRYAVGKAYTADRVTQGRPVGLLELAMVAELADHVARCKLCTEVSRYGGDRPADWITWATRNSRLGAYLIVGSPVKRHRRRPDAVRTDSAGAGKGDGKGTYRKTAQKRSSGQRWVENALAVRARREASRQTEGQTPHPQCGVRPA